MSMPDKKKRKRLLVWFLFICAGLLLSSVSAAEPGGAVVAVLPIKGTIDAGTENFVQRSLQKARESGAAAVILELDTPGGLILAADNIRKEMDDFRPPIYAYVRPDAFSAGAYLALAADAVYMAPGSNIGAAEPRFLGGGEVSEKDLSSWENKMKTVAERRGRDPQIAAAMVRKEIAIEGIVEEGVLLCLTAREALEAGYCEGIVESRDELLGLVNLPEAEIMVYSPSAADRLISWTTNPVIATLLLVVGIGAMVVEVLTAGFGLAGFISLIAFALYFGGHIIAGFAEYWVVILFVAGIVFMIVEAFIPGFGVFGIAGAVALLASIVLAASSIEAGLYMLAISLVLSGVFAYFSFRFLSRRGALRHIILGDEQRSDLGYVAPADYKHLLGAEGVTLTPLRPAGAAAFNGQRHDVVSEGEFIPKDTAIKVIKVEGVRIVVRRLATASGE